MYIAYLYAYNSRIEKFIFLGQIEKKIKITCLDTSRESAGSKKRI